MALKLGEATAFINVDDKGLMAGLSRAHSKFAAGMQRMQAVASKVGTGLLTMGAGLAAPVVGGVKAYADFEKQMAAVSTMVDDTDAHMGRFSQGVRDMSKEFGEGTGTLAKGLYDILSASVPAEQALGVLEVSAKAAKAGMTDTGVAADAITTILNSYALSADQAGSVSDLLFSIVKRGKTTMGELAPSIGMVATMASSGGVSLEEMGAALATMTRNGVQTQNAVTALNAIITSFLTPTKDAVEAAAGLGFEMSAATLKSEGLKGIFDKMAALPPDAVAKLFPNVRALRGVLPALQNMVGFTDDIAAMGDRAGATEAQLVKVVDTIDFKFGQLKQQALDIFVRIGEAVAEPLSKALAQLSPWVEKIGEFITKHEAWVVAAAKLIPVLLGVGLAFKALGVVASLGPMGLAITGIAIAVGLIATNWDAVTAAIGKAWRAVQRFFGVDVKEPKAPTTPRQAAEAQVSAARHQLGKLTSVAQAEKFAAHTQKQAIKLDSAGMKDLAEEMAAIAREAVGGISQKKAPVDVVVEKTRGEHIGEAIFEKLKGLETENQKTAKEWGMAAVAAAGTPEDAMASAKREQQVEERIAKLKAAKDRGSRGPVFMAVQDLWKHTLTKTMEKQRSQLDKDRNSILDRQLTTLQTELKAIRRNTAEDTGGLA